MDELAHIPAGYAYVHNLDFRLNPEHPPLLKALAGLPLLTFNPTLPTDIPPWQEVNGQWAMGWNFLYGAGNDADKIIQVARIGPMLLTLILVWLIYFWARELVGKFWALLPAGIFALSPNILAHGHYVTTDVAAAFGVFAATYALITFLLHPSRKHLIIAGIIFGVAQLAKFSAVLLMPYFIFLLIAFYGVGLLRDWRNTDPALRFKRFGIRAFRYVRALIVIFGIGYLLIVYPVYALFTVNYPQAKQTADTEFILASFADGPTPPEASCKPLRCLADLNIWLTKNPVTRPFAEYMLGVLMVLQRSSGGNTNYFLGEVSAAGWTSYFPVVYALKEPLPVLLMIFIAILTALRNMLGKLFRLPRQAMRFVLEYIENRFPEFAMLVFIILYWGWSMQSPLNIGFRHLFPTLPFIYILTASALKQWVVGLEVPRLNSFWQNLKAWAKLFFSAALKYIAVVVLVIWFILETLVNAPHFISYFNEIGGGKENGYRFVTDSNYDWGQDMLRLKKFVEANPEIDKIAVDYFGGANPKYYLGEDKAEYWWSGRGNPSLAQNDADQTQTNAENFPRESAYGQRKSAIHWLAVSVNTLEGAIQPTVPGQVRKPEEEYRWLTELRPPKPGIGNVPEPDYRAGTSIFIYKL